MALPSSLKVSDTTSIRVVPGVQEVEVTLSSSLAKGGASAANTFLDCLPVGEGVAISSTVKGEPPLTYSGLRHFLAGQNLRSQRGVGPGERIAIIMPNGPEMAVSLLLCMAQAVAVPLEATLSEADLVAAFEQLSVTQCFLLKLHKVYDDHIRGACRTTGVRLEYLVKGPRHAGEVLFSSAEEAQCSLSPLASPTVVEMAPVPSQPLVAGASDAGSVWTGLDVPAMLLRTSGTTSKPKVVPLTLRGMLSGSMSIADGLGLLDTDQCLNVMPYTHIGGISCNLLATLMAGASVRCAPAFDPARFLGWLEEFQPTWYYAVPTIHAAVRLASNGKAPKHSLRFIRNGAANLTDADARALQALFGCPVLPTYSMSECMPVAQPPRTYNLEKPGTVGIPIASSLRIVGEDGRGAAAASENGEIRGEVCISGPVVFAGYLDNPDANESSFFEDGGKRWFRTGDVGYLDGEGFLFLTGRNKELIKRAGEQVSPYEVEEILMKHPAVQTAVVFAVPNDFWGEEVAAAVVLKAGFSEQGVASEATMQALQKATSLRRQQSWSSLNQRDMALQAKRSGESVGGEVSSQDFMVFAARLLPEAKVPKQVAIVTEDQLPKTATKKYQRVGLWQKLGLQAVDLGAQQALCGPGGAAVPPPVEISRAVSGARCFFAFWVIVIHVGHFPQWMAVWRGLSVNMPAFFIMAGFLLEKATTRPIQNVRKFFRNRIIASHPLYLLMLVMNIGLAMLQQGVAAGFFGGVQTFILGFYGYAVVGGVTWFLLTYNICIFLFPWVHDAMNTWRFFSTDRANACTICAFTCVNSCLWLPTMAAAATSYAIFLFIYMHAFPMWFLKFVMGMLVFKIFERNRRGFDSTGETRWGWVTDLLSFGYLGMMAAMSLMVLSGMSATDTQPFWMLVSYALPFGCPLLCIWLYGLATGQGIVARFFAKPFISNTLSTATYGMFLFHMPLAQLWLMVRWAVAGPPPGLDGDMDPMDPNFMKTPLTAWEFPFYVAFVIAFSWYVTTYWSEILTAWFQKIFNCCYCCCCCLCSGVGILCWKPQEEEGEQGTLHVVVDSISNLTGADADATSKLDEIGLDSFGAGALVGLLVNRIPGLKLRAVDVYALETVGDLVVFIDKGLSEARQDSMPV